MSTPTSSRILSAATGHPSSDTDTPDEPFTVRGDVWSRVLSRDPASRTTEVFHYNAATDESVIEVIQDVEDLITRNRRLLNDSAGTRWGDGKIVASIPLNVYEQLRKQGITRDRKAMKKWLENPDNRAFRTRGGKV